LTSPAQCAGLFAARINIIMKIHDILEQNISEGPNDPHIFKAVFLAGGPGSGKSYVANKMLGGTGLRVVNSDDIYEYLMKKQDLSLDPETIFSPQGQEIRGRAKELTKKRRGHYLDGRIGIIIDGTGKDVGKVKKEAEALRELGYDTMMLFVNTSLDIAQERNQQRERKLEGAVVEKMWNTVQQNIMSFQQIFGAANFHVIDNSGGLEDPARKTNFDQTYREIRRFIDAPPQSHTARKWISDNQ
jgi:predicted kinase